MKKKILLVLAIIFTLVASACSNDTTDSGGNPQNPSNPYIGDYSAEFRGEWIRMDNGDRWYIDGKTITVNGTGSFPAVTLEKKSENVAVATDADKTRYTLFGARIANADFSAQIVLLDDGAGQKPPVKIINPKQQDLPPLIVQPNPQTGVISVQNLIPGDRLEIIPNSSEWSGVKVYLTPGFGKEQNLGVIPLTHGDNFKMSVRMGSEADDITELYADLVPRDYIFELENIGTTNGDAGWELSWNDDDFIFISGNKVEDYTNIAPGEKKQLTLRLAAKTITTATKNKEIKAAIWHYDAKTHRPKEWDDKVSINFHNTSVPFRFSSVKQVQGIIKTNKGKSYYFRTSKESSADYTTEVYVPWSDEPYTVAFLGATIEADSATKYSFAINDQPPVNWGSINSMDFLEKYKPANEYETTAPVLDLTTGVKSFMGYLASDSIDYYRVKLENSPPVPMLCTITFNANDAESGNAPADVTYNYNARVQLPGQGNMVKQDYYLYGWTADSSGAGIVYNAGSFYILTGDITLYAKWNPVAVTVTFDKNTDDANCIEGNPTKTVTYPPTTVGTLPSPPVRPGYTLTGWLTGDGSAFTENTIVTENITVYAQWTGGGAVPGANLAAKLSWLRTNALSNCVYTIDVNANESFTGEQKLSYDGQTNVTVQLTGNYGIRTISFSGVGSVFTVQSGVTLILDNNITIKGSYKGIEVGSGGKLVMRNGSVINGVTGVSGITNNPTTLYGAGVYVTGGTFTMEGGRISGNTASGSGGGVYMIGGTFNMSGGEISGNKAAGTSSTDNNVGNGGGVGVSSGTFNMSGGKISGNTAKDNGGGVFVGNYGTFNMSGGEISGSASKGGGVYVTNSSNANYKFTKTGGTISGTAASGKAVYVSSDPVKRRETTAGPTVNLDSKVEGAAGGWE